MITKKLGEEVYVWDPLAFMGKGYWFILGKNGKYGRAASKKDATKLGKIKPESKAEVPKKDIIKASPISNNTPIPEVSEETKESVEKTTKKFSPENMAKGIMKGKSFLSPEEHTKHEKLKARAKPRKENVFKKHLGLIYALVKTKIEEDKLKMELAKDFHKQQENDEQKRHEELVSALGGKGVRPTSKEDKKKQKEKKESNTLLKAIIGFVTGGIVGLLTDSKKSVDKTSQDIDKSKSDADKMKSDSADLDSKEAEKKKTTVSTREGAPAPTKAPGAGRPPSRPPSGAPAGKPLPPSQAEKAIAGGDPVKAMIVRHEGVRMAPYKDSLGLWTVGVGHLIGDGKSLPSEWNKTFSAEEVKDLFDQDYEYHKKAAEKIPGYSNVKGPGQGALIDLTFNMGPVWYKKWPTFTKKLSGGDIQGAAGELEKSRWYTQVGKRGPDIVAMLQSSDKGGSSSADATPSNRNTGAQLASASSTNKDMKADQASSGQNTVIVNNNNTTVAKSTTTKTNVVPQKNDNSVLTQAQYG